MLDAALQVAGDAGIVDEQRDGAEDLLGGVEGGGDARGVRDVERDGVGLAALSSDLGDQGVEAVRRRAASTTRRAMRGEDLGEAPAESRRGAGDQRHLAGQVEQLLAGVTLSMARSRRCRPRLSSCSIVEKCPAP